MVNIRQRNGQNQAVVSQALGGLCMCFECRRMTHCLGTNSPSVCEIIGSRFGLIFKWFIKLVMEKTWFWVPGDPKMSQGVKRFVQRSLPWLWVTDLPWLFTVAFFACNCERCKIDIKQRKRIDVTVLMNRLTRRMKITTKKVKWETRNEQTRQHTESRRRAELPSTT